MSELNSGDRAFLGCNCKVTAGKARLYLTAVFDLTRTTNLKRQVGETGRHFVGGAHDALPARGRSFRRSGTTYSGARM